MSYLDYRIIETDIGPMIHNTRVSVYDVMLAAERAAFYALREKNRKLRGENGDARDHQASYA